jgi:hypothetical protein
MHAKDVRVVSATQLGIDVQMRVDVELRDLHMTAFKVDGFFHQMLGSHDQIAITLL